MSHSLGDQSDFPTLEPGQVLDGRFVVHEIIGSGGMGMVLRLHHMEWNRDFALKLPRPDALKEERSRELFLKEAEAWIRLGVHPHIVRCWFVRPIDNLPGLFLDYLTGGSLKDKIESQAVLPGQCDRIIQILIQILEGLIHAHSKGMVHRDLKPDNLMVHGDGRVCLTDFGLVKLIGDTEIHDSIEGEIPADSWLTAGAMGTPRYAAPEQWLNPEAVNQTTDLYSLGVIMFELLCGRRPFDAPGEYSTSSQIIQRHLGEHPPHPNTIRDDVPPEMADLCLRMMSKASADRPETAEDVLVAVLRFLATRSPEIYHRPPPVPSGEFPDFLNNAGVSLYSLGKTGKARELFLKGLMLQAGHFQCLYNLVQLDRREGKLGREEALRRLRRARADFGLALLYLEGCQGKLAAEVLSRIPMGQKSGFLHRLEGDALMYAGEFDAAQRCYQNAAEKMPNDLTTRFRLELARKNTVAVNGRVYFPPLGSTHRAVIQRPGLVVALSPDAEMVLALDDSELFGLSVAENRVIKQAKRGLYAAPVLWSDAFGTTLLLQDRGALEIWDLDGFQMISRIEGKIMARDTGLKRLLVASNEEFVVFDRSQQSASPLLLTPELQISNLILAVFDLQEKFLILLTQTGQLFFANQSGQLTPLHFPPAVEEAGKVNHMCCGRQFIAFSYRNTLLRCYDLKELRLTIDLELGFLPTSLVCDESGTLILASSPKSHVILDRHGRFVSEGPGPIAMDRERKRCLLWDKDRLLMFRLNPFQHLRTWEEEVPRPRELSFSADGRRGLSLDDDLEYRIWDLDEDHRVFERQLLMTPGQTYQEIVNGFECYQTELDLAVELRERKAFYESYQALQRAREVAAFHQAEEALDLQWTLCAELQRDGLEAVWERLYFPDIVSGRLSSDCRHLLLARSVSVELLEISGPRIESRLFFEPGYPLFSAHFLRDGSTSGLIVCFGLDGEIGYYCGATGESKFQNRLKTGRLFSVQFCGEFALVQNSSGQAFSLNIGSGVLSEPLPMLERGLKNSFLLDRKQALLITYNGPLFVDLDKRNPRPEYPAEVKDIPHEITFCCDPNSGSLRLVGFSDGTFVLSDRKSGRALFTFRQEDGAVSGLAVNLNMALGVSVSDQGGLTLVDLAERTVLEHFAAHEEAVAELSLTTDGRYITTRSVNGHFRLWEISWLLSERTGSVELEWLRSSVFGKLGSLFRRK